MKINKSQSILLIICFSLITAGCQQPKFEGSVKILKKGSKKQVTLNTVEKDLVKDEGDFLLRDLKLKNPFRRDHSSGISLDIQGITILRGIIWDKDRPYALIGESVLTIGEMIDGKKVLKITKDSVVLDNNGQNETLKLETPIKE